MASGMATNRLRKELLAIKRNPLDNIIAAPLDSNILEWHYVITGTKDSPYEGGHYHGKLKFPADYPMKPPSVLMLTPNGRFQCGKRLCLSMSDFHPETWNPVWSVSTILMGLYSFMLESATTLGSVTSSSGQKRKLAAESLEFNCKNVAFRKLFPELVELHEQRQKEMAAPTREVDTRTRRQGTRHTTNGSPDMSGTNEANVVTRRRPSGVRDSKDSRPHEDEDGRRFNVGGVLGCGADRLFWLLMSVAIAAVVFQVVNARL